MQLTAISHISELILGLVIPRLSIYVILTYQYLQRTFPFINNGLKNLPESSRVSA